MSSIKDNIDRINKEIMDTAVSCGRKPDSVQLIAVSKKKSIETVLEGIKSGAGHLGENYIQEAIEKIDAIGKDRACWHFIGHLQSNKAKFAVQYFDYIHTVDTLKLAKEIHRQAKKINKIQNILMQINIGQEDTKSGTGIKEAVELAEQISTFENVSLHGLMCLPPYFSEPEQARIYFKQMVQIKGQIMALQLENVSMECLSMGMSNDFQVAIEEGSTMVRIGTSIFGARE
ncbi:YggS family pyridoxal phosphate-dependent enzyme [Desulfobacula sp.]|uniref:YggS family pyridoxal phosphate-dependent enzyme n=1 Tax=Desulfobacula sp. TaxID=2593537 RepID=UPI00260B3B98|nr:YggS family pyridoxal phosphate-dependent enzyme [Desulfobacula sp.]